MLHRSPLKAARFQDLEDRFPAEDPAEFFAGQRAWVRRVNGMLDLSHHERSAAIFIGMMCSPDRPYCVAGTAYICKSVGCERTAIFRACRKLVEAGLMQIESRKRAGNIYRIIPPIGAFGCSPAT